MRPAEWILTFDDGPLPADVTTYQPGDGDALLAPLRSILATLQTHQPHPIPAVFFLRGPAYPWKAGARPPKGLFKRGVRMIVDAGHLPAIHCYSHDPDLWWNWWVRGGDIHHDLDRCVEYFGGMVPEPLRVFRPPYGQGGLAGWSWAVGHQIRHRRWDIDTEDWLHHPDVAPILRRFADDQEAGAHLAHILQVLPARMWMHTMWPGANDFLLHVSRRTADHLPAIIDRIVDVTRAQNHEPQFVVPPSYAS